MERRRDDSSPAGSDDCDLRDNQSVGMAALRDRMGATMLDDRSRLRPADDYRFRARIAIRAKRGRVCLFRGNDAVACSACCVVRSWDTDLLRRHPATASRPLASAIVAGGCAFGTRVFCGPLLSPGLGLALEIGVLFTVFAGILLIVTGQKSLYLDLLRGLRSAPAASRSDATAAVAISGRQRKKKLIISSGMVE